MRVAMIDPSLFTVPYDRELASGLKRIGHDVTLYGRRRRALDETLGTVELAPVFYPVAESAIGLALPGSARLGIKGVDHLWSMMRLLRLLRRQRPDIIHFQWLPLPLVDAGLLHRFRRIAPVVLTVHDTNPFNGAASAGIQRRGVQRCLENVDRLIVHTDQGRRRLTALGIAPERTDVLAHGMLVTARDFGADPIDGQLTFLLFGKIRPYKGADLLIDAFAALPEAVRTRCRLRIVGKPYMDIAPLQEAARRHGISVEWQTDFVPDSAIAGLFGPGVVAVFPYREIEASGVLFLAIAHGRPIIASRLGAFAELLTDGEQGHLLPTGEVAPLTAAMRHMADDREFAAAAAASVQRLAEGIPDWEEIARGTIETYQRAATSAERRNDPPTAPDRRSNGP